MIVRLVGLSGNATRESSIIMKQVINICERIVYKIERQLKQLIWLASSIIGGGDNIDIVVFCIINSFLNLLFLWPLNTNI